MKKIYRPSSRAAHHFFSPGIAALLIFVCAAASAQHIWVEKTPFGGDARHRATAISIGNRGYMGLGHYNSVVDVHFQDWWEYDPGTNTWTQKADFGGGKRDQAAGFTIDNFGYVGTGRDQTLSNKKDFWKYNPVTNTWTQISDFGGTARHGGVGFAISKKGYVGTGDDGTYRKDFWEYDPSTDTWTQKTNFGGAARIAAVGFSIGGYGYIGTGNAFSSTKDFWQYDPSNNSWTQKANVGTTNRQEATGFSINGKGYIGTGDDFSSGNNFNDFWEYDVAGNTWTQIEDFAGTARRYMSSFTIGNLAFCSLGSNGTNLKDLWEFGTPAQLGLDSLSGTVINKAAMATVYPTVVSSQSQITIVIKDESEKSYTFEMFSVQGCLARKIKLSNTALNTIHGLDVPTGIYFYRITGDAQIISCGKIILE